MNIDLYRNEQPPHREVLPGGAVLLSTPIPTAHAVTLGVWLRTGSQDEPDGLGGISHFLEHMVFKGTRHRVAYEIAREFDGMGVVVDAFTTKDTVAFTVKVLPEYFIPAMELLGEMLLEPAFAPKMVSLEQGVVIEEIQEALDTPDDRLHDAFAARLYGRHRRGRPILGTPGAVRSFQPDVLHNAHRRLFCGPNMVISMAGNIQDGFRDAVARRFDVGPADPDPGARFQAEDPAIKAAFVDISLENLDPFRLEIISPIIQTYFEIGNLGVALGHPDRIPVFLLTNILGGGMSSRIFQAVREREGLAYSIYNYNELIFSLEGMVNQMFRAARNEIYYGRFVPVADLVDLVDSVTSADLRRCAAKYFDPGSLLVATHGPQAQVGGAAADF